MSDLPQTVEAKLTYVSPQYAGELIQRIEELKSEVARLTQERDALTVQLGEYEELLQRRVASYDSLPDHFREMAARFAEDRDQKKHALRAAEEKVTRLVEALRQLQTDMREHWSSFTSDQAMRKWIDRLAAAVEDLEKGR